MAAVVMPAEEGGRFVSSLRRSHSAPKFSSKSAGFRTSSSASRISDIEYEPVHVFSGSGTASPPSSPQGVPEDHTGFTPSPKAAAALALGSRFALDLDSSQPGESFALPQYGGDPFFSQLDGADSSPSPAGLTSSYNPSDENTTSTGTSRPETPDLFFEHAEDDSAVRAQPSRHVDYLSHDWKEEDIWESWKFIVARRGDYSNAARLENASWRTWMKSKNRLRTVSPETLNWLKDCDVTWLYGPLQTGNNSLLPPPPTDSVELTKSNSFLVNKKPILKKRSVSELMLQRSLSTSSLIKQAAAAVQAQENHGVGRPGRPRMGRAISDYVALPLSSRRVSPGNTSLIPSSESSGFISPSAGRKHIHFNEQVAQCIAVDVKGEDEEESEPPPLGHDSDSDDGAIMMKQTAFKKRRPLLRRKSSSNNSAENKTIAMLPSTTLKSRDDSPDAESGTAMRHSYRSPVLSPSSSQETLRPAKPSGSLFLMDEEEDEEEDEDEPESEPVRRSSTPRPTTALDGPHKSSSSGLKRTTSSSGLLGAGESGAMRRTESGMLMPYDEGEPAAAANAGIVGRVIDTVNTARDIAHVIWNVGWRK